MAESTLSLSRDALRVEIGHFLGYGRTAAAWSTDQQADIDGALVKGLRQFYFPPKLPGDDSVHQWSFLRPVTTLDLWPTIAVGTATVTGVLIEPANTSTTVTASVASFYASMVGASITITDIGTFTITEFSSSTVVVVTGDAKCEAKTFSFTTNGTYALPDDCGGIDGDITYPANDGYDPMSLVGEGRIRQLMQQSDDTGRPLYASMRPKVCDGAGGQRFELFVWPMPDVLYTVSYPKVILANALTANNPYPLGGAAYADAISASCIAAAELQNEDTHGERYKEYMSKLTAAVVYDRKHCISSPDYYGYNSDRSDYQDRIVVPRTSVVTYRPLP